MGGTRHLYLMVLGVATAFQGQGLGTKLMKALVEESEQAGIPIYLETQTETNVQWYEKLGFRQIKQVTLPVINLPQWELVREPGT